MDTTGGYQSLLGLTSINSNSSTIDVLEVENININGVIDLSQAIVGGLTTSQVDEGLNLYYTDTRVNNNSNVSSNTTHRDRTDNPHGVTATQVGINTTDDISEGVTNLYYTDIRFDDRLATKTTTSLAEGTNLYYTDARFDTRFGIKTTTSLAEGSNLYYTDARFDTRFGIKTTTNLTEGTNLYYTDARVSTNTDVKANSNYRNIGHLPLAGGTLSGNLNMGNQDIDNVNQVFIDRKGLANNKLVLWDNGSGSTTEFLGFGIQANTLMYNVNASTDNHKFYYAGTNELFRIGHAGVFSYRNLDITGNITLSGTVDGVDLAALNTAANNHIANTNNPHGVLATQITDFDTEVSANTDVKANSDYRAVGHLPLSGGTLTGNLDMGNYDIDNVNQVFIDRKGLANNKIVLYDNGTSSTTDFYGFGIQSSTLVYNVNAIASNHKFYYLGTNELFRIGHAGVFSYRNLDVTGDLSVSGTVDGVDVATLNTTVNNHIANTNNPHGVLASQITDFDTEVSDNVDVKANSDYRSVGHLPLSGGGITGDLDMNYNTIKNGYLIEIRENETTPVWTSDTTNEGIGWYLDTSNNDRLPVYLAFNNTYGPSADLNDAWFPSDLTGNYNTDGTVNTASVPTTTLADTTVLYGEWIQIANTNRTMRMYSFILATRNHPYYSYPTDFTILGSQEGASWYVVYETTGLTFSSQAEFKTINTTPNGYYKYFRFIVQRVFNVIGDASAGYPRIGEWRPSFVYSGNLDSTLIEDVKANTAKVSADGSIDTHSDVSILEVKDQQFLKYSSGSQKWENVSPTTTMIAEGSNLYYTDARFDTRFGIKTTTNLVEGTNLYYTDSRFDTRLATKTTTNLVEGTNLYYTDARFDTRFGIKTTTNLTEGTNLYYTEARVSANTDVKANSDYRAVGHLPLAGGIMTGDIEYVSSSTFEVPLLSSNTSASPDFIASESSYYVIATLQAWKLFDASLETTWHIDLPYDYVANTTYNGTYQTALDGGTKKGQWIQIQTASETILTQFIITPYVGWLDRSPIDFVVGISTDGTNFTTIFTKTAESWTVDGEPKTYTGITTMAGTYFRVIITKTGSAGCGYAKLEMTFANKTTLLKADGGVVMTGDLNMGAFNITNVGTVDGVDVAALNTTANNHIANTNNPHGVLATQITDFDTEVSDNTDVKANTAYTAVGHLPLAGGTLTGDIDINTNDITNIGDLVFAETTTVNPPPLTSDSGNAEYIASSSGVYDENRPAWEAFDGSIADGQQWISLSGVYNTSGTYLGTETTTVDGSPVSGEWLQLATTVRYWIDSFILFCRDVPYLNQAPKDIVVAVSDDGTNFNSVFTTTGLTFTESTPQTFTGITPTGGKYFRLISTKSASSGLVAVSRFDMTFRTFITLNSTLIADVAANSTKVSADGSINTHSDVNITTPADGHLLTYNSGEWKNLAPSGGTYVKIDGTSTMTGDLNMGNYDIDNVNQIFVDRKSTLNNKIVLYDGGTPSTTTFYGFGIQTATLLYNVGASVGNHKFYYGGANELFRIGDAGVYSYRDLDVKGDTTISGEMNIGGAKIARGATNGLQLYGPSGNLSGPHIQAFVSTDDYPVYQQLNLSHNNVNMVFDSYYDGSWRSSSTSSNLLIYKASTNLYFQYDSGISLGGAITWNIGFSMDLTNGLVSCKKGLDVKGDLTVSGTVDGVDVAALNTTANNAIPLASHNTYVPTIGDGTNNFTLTSATGHYTVIGNMCHVSFYVLWTSKGSASGTIRLSLPFTSATGPYSSMALSAHNGIDASLPSIGCFNLSATNYVVFFDKPVGLFAMNQTSFTNAGAICGSGFFYL